MLFGPGDAGHTRQGCGGGGGHPDSASEGWLWWRRSRADGGETAACFQRLHQIVRALKPFVGDFAIIFLTISNVVR